MEKQPSWILIS